MAKKILLLFPPSFEPNVTPPLGIAFLAASLRHAGYEVELWDLTIEPRRRHDWQHYSIVGMSLLCVNFNKGAALARHIRQKNRNLCIVAGGPFADTCSKEVLETGLFDVVVHGEGETAFVHLVEALKNGRDFSGINGLSFLQGDEIIRTHNSPLAGNLDTLPFPAYDLLPVHRYEELSIIASRGCPFRCVFCTRGPTEAKTVRQVTPEHLTDWITLLRDRFACNNIRFVDSTFTVDQEWSERLCDLIMERKLKFHWTCQTRLDCVNGRLLEKMKRAGCQIVTVGAESGNDEILSLLGKDFSKTDVRSAAQLFHDVKAPQLNLNFIIGHPWDTRDTIGETVGLAKELRRDFGARYKLFLLVPFPGTELWDNAKEYGLTITRDWEKFCKYSFMGNPARMAATFSTRNFSREELTTLYHGLEGFWFPLAVRCVKQTQQMLRQLLNRRFVT